MQIGSLLHAAASDLKARSFPLKAVLPLLLTACPSLVHAQSCPAPDLSDPADLPAATPGDESIQITSEGAEVSRTGDAVLKGKVRIRQGDRTLSAENATFNAAEQTFSVSGTVTYRDPEMRIKGKSASVATAGAASFEGAEFDLPAQPARGSADQIKVSQGSLQLAGVVYTTCPAGNEDWVLRAGDININPGAGLGVGRNVRLDFKGIPILYTPFISFPVGNQRKSGFLFPTLANSSRSGLGVQVPWYWNIAPNYDATFTGTWYTQRGFDLLTDFRFLTERSRGNVTAEYLPNDTEYGNDRNLVRLFDQTDFNSRLRFTASAANASDREWFEDFGEGPEGTSVVYLGRFAELSYLDRHWAMTGRVQNFQTIQPVNAADRPYTLLPQISIAGQFPSALFGFDAGLETEYTYFQRDSSSVTGSRFDFHPGIKLPLQSAGAFIEPSLSWRYTAYDLDNVAPGAETSPSRSAPIASIDAGLTFERLAGSRQQRVHTFEPRILYLYVPYRDQSSLPVFDTGEPDLNLVQLYRDNRYVGPDRLGDANQLSVGFTTRLLDRESGRQFLSATAGQAYYFDSPRVVLPNEPVLGYKSSNLLAQMEVSAFKNWNARMGVQWDPHETRSEKGEARLQYAPAYNKVANVGYRFRRGSLEQWDASVAWPVTDTWTTYGGMTYSLKDEATINQFAGLEYRSCCWKARIVARKYVSSRTGETDSDVQLQLELNGLASLVPGVDAFLERSIRGYSVLPPATPR